MTRQSAAERRTTPQFQKARIAELARYATRPQSDPEKFLSGYRARRARIIRTNLKIPDPVLDAVAGQLDPRQSVARARIADLVGIRIPYCGLAYRALCLRFGQVPAGPIGKHRPLPPDPLAPGLLAAVSPMPQTRLDPDTGAIWPSPNLRVATKVLRLRSKSLRLAAGIALTLGAARGISREAQHHLIIAFAALDRCLRNTAPRNPIHLSQALAAYLTDESLAPATRQMNWRRWVVAFGHIDAYCVEQPAFALRYAPWRLTFPKAYCAPLAGKVMREARQRAQARRADRCSPVAHDRASIDAVYDARYREIEIIRQAFDRQCADIRAGTHALRNGRKRFEVTLPSHTADGEPVSGVTTLDFAVVSPSYLQRRAAAKSHALVMGCRRDFWLVYRGTVEGHEPPIFAMYRAGCFYDPRYATNQQRYARAQLLPPAQWATSLSYYGQFRFARRFDTRMAARCFHAGITVIPIDELHFAVAVGRAIARSVLAGARIGEAMQQRAEPDAFRAVRVGGTRAFVYDAVPKQSTAPETYFLYETDFRCILAVVEVQRANGWTMQVIQPAGPLRNKCPPALYLYQRGGRALGHGELSAAVRLPLWPRCLASHDLRHGQARYLLRQGVSKYDIAGFLHHTQPAPTSMINETLAGAAVGLYTSPTPDMRAETFARITGILEANDDQVFSPPLPAGCLRPPQPETKANGRRPRPRSSGAPTGPRRTDQPAAYRRRITAAFRRPPRRPVDCPPQSGVLSNLRRSPSGNREDPPGQATGRARRNDQGRARRSAPRRPSG